MMNYYGMALEVGWLVGFGTRLVRASSRADMLRTHAAMLLMHVLAMASSRSSSCRNQCEYQVCLKVNSSKPQLTSHSLGRLGIVIRGVKED